MGVVIRLLVDGTLEFQSLDEALEFRARWTGLHDELAKAKAEVQRLTKRLPYANRAGTKASYTYPRTEDEIKRNMAFKSIRKKIGYSQYEMGKLLGVNQTLISLIETNAVGCKIEFLELARTKARSVIMQSSSPPKEPGVE